MSSPNKIVPQPWYWDKPSSFAHILGRSRDFTEYSELPEAEDGNKYFSTYESYLRWRADLALKHLLDEATTLDPDVFVDMAYEVNDGYFAGRLPEHEVLLAQKFYSRRKFQRPIILAQDYVGCTLAKMHVIRSSALFPITHRLPYPTNVCFSLPCPISQVPDLGFFGSPVVTPQRAYNSLVTDAKAGVITPSIWRRPCSEQSRLMNCEQLCPLHLSFTDMYEGREHICKGEVYPMILFVHLMEYNEDTYEHQGSTDTMYPYTSVSRVNRLAGTWHGYRTSLLPTQTKFPYVSSDIIHAVTTNAADVDYAQIFEHSPSRLASLFIRNLRDRVTSPAVVDPPITFSFLTAQLADRFARMHFTEQVYEELFYSYYLLTAQEVAEYGLAKLNRPSNQPAGTNLLIQSMQQTFIDVAALKKLEAYLLEQIAPNIAPAWRNTFAKAIQNNTTYLEADIPFEEDYDLAEYKRGLRYWLFTLIVLRKVATACTTSTGTMLSLEAMASRFDFSEITTFTLLEDPSTIYTDGALFSNVNALLDLTSHVFVKRRIYWNRGFKHLFHQVYAADHPVFVFMLCMERVYPSMRDSDFGLIVPPEIREYVLQWFPIPEFPTSCTHWPKCTRHYNAARPLRNTFKAKQLVQHFPNHSPALVECALNNCCPCVEATHYPPDQNTFFDAICVRRQAYYAYGNQPSTAVKPLMDPLNPRSEDMINRHTTTITCPRLDPTITQVTPPLFYGINSNHQLTIETSDE